MDTNPTTTNKTPTKNLPGKYIRTLAGDIQTLKEGGIPDLVPLAPSKVEPKDHFVAVPKTEVRFSPPPPPPPPPIPIPVPVPSIIPVQKSISESPPPPIVPQPLPVSASFLKTYEGDFSQRMQDTHSSAATVLAAEQDSATGTPQTPPQKSSPHGLLFGIAGSLLLIASGIGVYVAYTKYLDKTLVIFTPVVSAPIFVDEREQLSGTGLGLFQAIEQSVAQMIAIGTVRLLYLETSTTTPDSVFSALRLPASDILLRNVNVEGSMAGVVNTDGRQSPFFILSVDSYSETFAGMLQWEPHLLQDFTQIFPPYSTLIRTTSATSTVATSTVATSTAKTAKFTSKATSTPSIPSVQLTFVDEVVANHDVRIYRDAAGQSVLLYGYWNQTTLVIARDPAAFSEILQRLATSRAQ
jgi:hypothetical protein